MEKSPEAFRTISEVADWLGVPTHVLRFWESRFAQIKPVKRAGGRRYYRPADMALIGGIKRLLHDEGMTIRGAQKLLREKGVKHVAALSQPVDGGMAPMDVIELGAIEVEAPLAAAQPPKDDAAPQSDPVTGPIPEPAPEPVPEPAPEPVARFEPEATEEPETAAEGAAEEAAPAPAPVIPETPDIPDTDPEDDDTTLPGLPGLAARIRIAERGYLVRNRGALAIVRDRLATRAAG